MAGWIGCISRNGRLRMDLTGRWSLGGPAYAGVSLALPLLERPCAKMARTMPRKHKAKARSARTLKKADLSDDFFFMFNRGSEGGHYGSFRKAVTNYFWLFRKNECLTASAYLALPRKYPMRPWPLFYQHLTPETQGNYQHDKNVMKVPGLLRRRGVFLAFPPPRKFVNQWKL